MRTKKVTIKPCESIHVDSQIEFELPDGLKGTLVVLLTIQMMGLKLQNDNSIEGKQTLVFKKNKVIGSLIILNEK